MATLKDTSVKNLLVSENLTVNGNTNIAGNADINGDATINGKLICNDLGLEVVTVSTSRYTFPSNSWVVPFSYYGGWYDITDLVTSVEGFIGVVGSQCIASSGVAMPSRCNLNASGVYEIQGISGYAENWFNIDVLRIKPTS